MEENVKLRLYVSIIILAMMFLYVSPIVITGHVEAMRSEFVQNCYKETSSFDYCWRQSKDKVDIALWQYVLPYLPAAALLWLSWLFKPNLRLSVESFPKRTITVVLWIGLLAATAGIGFPIWYVTTATLADVESRIVLRPAWISSAWLIAPLLFHHLVAPATLMESMRKGKVALLLLALSPVVAGVILIVREMFRIIALSAPN